MNRWTDRWANKCEGWMDLSYTLSSLNMLLLSSLIGPLDKNPLNRGDLVDFEELSLQYSGVYSTGDNYSRQSQASVSPPAVEVVPSVMPQSGKIDGTVFEGI